MKKFKGPKILFLDIETAPILASVWGLWENNVPLNMIEKDWHVLSWSAKWQHEDRVMYADQSSKEDITDDKTLMVFIWKLLDEADIVVTHNGKAFDHKKLNARFVVNGLKPPSSFKYIDTFLIAKKHFAFTSNKLEYLCQHLNVKYKKHKHEKFPGFELWKACLSGNKEAWKEMEKYNKYDVLALEELYRALIPWDNSINFGVYEEATHPKCSCGSVQFHSKGFAYTATGKYRRYVCACCGSENRDRNNLLSKLKRKTLTVKTTR